MGLPRTLRLELVPQVRVETLPLGPQEYFVLSRVEGRATVAEIIGASGLGAAITEQIVEVRGHAREAQREVKVGLNGFIIARDTEAEAKDVLREIVEKANRPAVEGFRSAVQQAGNSTADKKGMWADSTFEDLVQYNDGFRTGLIGTPEQIAERIAAYRRRGVDLILGGFLHFQEEIEYFGARVLPLVREIEAAESGSADRPLRISA